MKVKKNSGAVRKGKGGFKGGGKFNNKPKSRKEMRKQKKAENKLVRQKHFLAKTGGKKSVPASNEGNKFGQSKKKGKRGKKNKPNLLVAEDKEITSDEEQMGLNIEDSSCSRAQQVSLDVRRDEEKLKKEMEITRKRRLVEDNQEEDRNIRKLEKLLKLDKRKKKKPTIPASFKEDGLDCKKR